MKENMTVDSELSAKLKQCQLYMLKDYIRVCRHLGLSYYVVGGTLLGAVRHQGFIPWDDDIDVAMPRADYECFLEKGQALLCDGYFLQTFRTDPEFPANFAKIRDNGTTFIERSVSGKEIHHGVYIDLFPLDYYPDGLLARGKLELCRFFMKMRISKEFVHPEGEPALKMVIRKILEQVGRVLYPDWARTMEKREELYKSASKGRCICNYSGAWGRKEIWPAEWISESCELVFEGVTVSAPGEYHKMLKHFYGDYMTLPPPERRVSHHETTVIDLERPYTAYLKK